MGTPEIVKDAIAVLHEGEEYFDLRRKIYEKSKSLLLDYGDEIVGGGMFYYDLKDISFEFENVNCKVDILARGKEKSPTMLVGFRSQALNRLLVIGSDARLATVSECTLEEFFQCYRLRKGKQRDQRRKALSEHRPTFKDLKQFEELVDITNEAVKNREKRRLIVNYLNRN